MSRSYKKTPYSGDRKDKDLKRYANKKVRRTLKSDLEVNYNNREYKKLFQSYDICDYCTILRDFEDYYNREVDRWYRWMTYPFLRKHAGEFPTREKAYVEFVKRYKRK